MFDKLHAKLTGQKLHDFDLERPTVLTLKTECIGISGTEMRCDDELFDEKIYQFPKYYCKKCGKSLMLDPWQMRDLPWELKIGCK